MGPEPRVDDPVIKAPGVEDNLHSGVSFLRPSPKTRPPKPQAKPQAQAQDPRPL